jgi:glutathione S-transferase
MITLYTFGPFLGTPDSSPFVMKAMVLLKLAGLEYREQGGGIFRAPKGLLPFIDDDGEVVADSTFIRFQIEASHGRSRKWLKTICIGRYWMCAGRIARTLTVALR